MESRSRSSSFDGTAGRLSGPLMARMNRDMELAAIDELAPAPDASVLAIGFGPGVGVTELAERLPSGVVGGVDPSAVMLQQARRRNQSAVECGQVTLEHGTADSIPWPDGTFTGALAVNSIQFWDPLDASVREVVRVLAPAARLVSITHVWAIEKRTPLEQWLKAAAELLAAAGFDDIVHRTAPFRSGQGLVLRGEKRRPCNQNAP
jgi:ubiquinone/menaquinone biosynthesis C-methylase UbiE